MRRRDADPAQDDVEAIEIELDDALPVRERTAGAAARWRRSGPAHDADPEVTPAPGEDRRTVVAALAAAFVLVAVVSFAAGRAGRSGDAQLTAPTASTDVVATTRPPGPAVTPPRTTTVRPPTTTQPAVDVIELGRPVLPAPTGATLVGIDADGDLATVDLDAGRVTVTDLGRSLATEAQVVALSSSTLVLPWDGSTPLLVRDGQPAERFVHAPDGGSSIFAGPLPDTVWRTEYREVAPFGTTIHLTDMDGVTAGPTVDLDTGYPSMSDLRGGVIAEATGGSYDAGPDGVVVRLTTGRVVALGLNHAVVKECDEVLDCRFELVDRATGERRPMPGVIGGEGAYVGDAATIAPDGSAIVVYGTRGSLFGLTVVRIDDGTVTDLPSLGGGQPSVAWTPDGRFVLFGVGRAVGAYDTQTAQLLELPDGMPPLGVFRLRPSAVAAGPAPGTLTG